MKWMQWTSIRWKLTMFVAVVMIVTAARLSGAGYLFARKTLRDQINARLSIVASGRQKLLLDHLQQRPELDASTLEALNDPTGLGQSGEVLVAMRQGERITFLLSGRNGMPLPDIPVAEAPAALTAAIDGKKGFLQGRNRRGVEVLAAYLPVGYGGWGLVAQIEAAEAYAPVTRLRNRLLLIATGILIAGLGASYYVARKFTKPILHMATMAGDIAHGSWNARVNVDGHDELAALGRAFNRMAEDLSQSYHALEDRVRERTADLARVNETLAQKNRHLENDLAMAREVQETFLPKEYPSFPPGALAGQSALRFCHVYKPALSLGGDFFVVLPLADQRAGIFLCDVLGHGIRATVVMSIVHGMVEELRTAGDDPGKFLGEVNRALIENLKPLSKTIFVSALYVVIDAGRGELLEAIAGHPSPLWLRRDAGRAESLPAVSGSALGLIADEVYVTTRQTLALGDVIVLFCAGIYQVERTDGETFGMDRLLSEAGRRVRLGPAQLLDELIAQVKEFSVNGEFDDDVCLVAVEYAGARQPSGPGRS